MPDVLLSQVCKAAAERTGMHQPEPSVMSDADHDSYRSEVPYYNSNFMTTGDPKTLVGNGSVASSGRKSRPPIPSILPDIRIDDASKPRALMDEELSMQYADAELYSHIRNYGKPQVGKKTRMFVLFMRIFHTLSSIMLAGCFGAMEAYMLSSKFELVAIPLTVSRIILISTLLVLVLCDWAVPKRIHRYFPIYNFQHSHKALGLSQFAVSFFALSDPALVSMDANRQESAFAQVLFPLVILASSFVAFVGVVYFIIGIFGGVKLRTKMFAN
ncbi:hypothetical protein LPJ78_001407 [Coemansia sp. RSA 989]|nr:hypothetical protein BX667DRAFT_503589 [Coemansia mojavensis]KAJ1752118.1 hypothetical protein LPJ79_001527 [Coemansia sp. RSA 1821]KAJ1866983.1 hypothetical protein LPJ78_001407 [Coemansia sp. RSA 989]KAJ1874217.1 hypothetical protein LPJ55_001704 [Coemansia sp. RSA 990]KAJ2627312.1 hypothetical protein H4R22_004459 [Coemansia sp. RSA 1290]KAJ2649755.1 hypothetical protein IWW40_002931 [Coemansia sp. RSA 1250]KAJ2670876.1 hypothetical protein IWW42_003745 [Coemansia sp. RSA 1085]